ncbi:MAG: prolyl oligopeptidase family serine peptidase [Pseudomonadota bacterium]
MLRKITFLLVFLIAAALGAEPLPIEHFVKDSDYLDVALSPSGKHLAARVGIEGRVVMVVLDRETNEIVGRVAPGEGSAVHSVEWINDKRLLFSYSADTIDLDAAVPTGELFGVDFNGKRLELLAGFRASDAKTGTRLRKKDSDKASFYLVNTLEGDEKHVLIISHPWSLEGNTWYDNRNKFPTISRMNVYNGRQKPVETLPFRNATAYSTNDGKVRFVTYENEDSTFSAAFRENEDAEWQPLKDVFDLGREMLVVGLNKAGDAAFLRGAYGDEGYQTIYRLDFATRSVEPVFTDLDADIIDWVADAATGEIAAGKSVRGKPRYHYAADDSEMQYTHKKLAKAFVEQEMDILSWTQDGTEFVVRVSSDTNPGSYYLFNDETNKADFFWANLSWIDPRQMRPMLIDEVETPDGFSLPVRLTLPEGPGPAPLVVHPHGGPHGVADLWTFDRQVQFLANRGYAVLQVNFRGSGHFGSRFRQAGYREWGGKMIDDIALATKWAMERPDIDGDRVCAYGASYGAYATYMLAAREPELLKCAAGYVGVYDLSAFMTTGDIPASWGGKGYLERVLGTDESVLEAYSPVNHAGQIQANTLLVHGDRDIRAPIAHAKAMRKALEAAGNAPVWIELGLSGHGAGSLKNRLKLYEGLVGFLDANLKASN